MHELFDYLPLAGLMAILASVTAAAAKMKGRSPVLWFFLGAVFGVFGMALAAILPNADRRCPICGGPAGKAELCETCGAPALDPETRLLLVPGRRYTDICPRCSLPYAKGDYDQEANHFLCARCNINLRSEQRLA
jgi:hypothetical protein